MEDADSGTQRARVLRVATRCTTADQFVEAFARFCEGRTLFVSSLSTRPIGTRLPFVILLADGTRAMRGQCEVVESYANPGNVYRRPGVKLALVELDDEGETMLSRLQRARAARDARTSAQAASAAPTELPPDASRATISAGAAPPPLPGTTPASPTSSGPPPPPRSPGRAASGRPPVPPLPKLPGDVRRQTPAAGAPTSTNEAPAAAATTTAAAAAHWLAPQPLPGLPVAPPGVPMAVADAEPAPGGRGGSSQRLRHAESGELRTRASSAAVWPPPDPTDDGWSDEEVRAGRRSTAPPVGREPEPPPPAPTDDDGPAMIVAAAPDRAGAADVAAAGDAMDAVPVVELINRTHRRDTGRNLSARSITASGRVSAQFSSPRARSTPGDVYSPEERTPGSTFVLPANPLSNLTDESLQGFIDCTIYEDNSQANPLSDPAISGSQLGMVEDDEPEPGREPDFRAFAPSESSPQVVTPAPRRSTKSMPVAIDVRPEPRVSSAVDAVRARPTTQSMASIDEDEDEDDVLPPVSAPALVVPASVPRARPPRPTPPPLPPSPRSARPPSSAPDWLTAPVPAPERPRQSTKPPPRPTSRWLLPSVFLLFALAAAAAYYLRHRDRAGRTAAPVGGSGLVTRDAAVASVVVDAGVAPDAVAVGDAGTAAALAIDAAVTATASGVCRLQVTTTPAGAAVSLGSRPLGAAPIDQDVECGAATLSARLPRYRATTRPVTLTPGTPGVFKLKLARPSHSLTVLSTPRGALVTIDGRRVGTTPLTVEVAGFTRHAITIEAKDYQLHRTSVTTDETEQTVAVPLVKSP